MTTPPPAPAPNTRPQYAEYSPESAYRKTNTLAIIAIVLGFVVPVGGIITGHIALGQIKQTHEGGRELALAGTIIGYVLTGLGIIGIVVWLMFTFFFVNLLTTLPPVV
jgi:hypothetical protein